MMVGVLLLFMQLVTGVQEANRDVVVTGKRLEDTERELADCIARKCSPKQDIAATVAQADAQFVAGDYRGARATILAGRTRNAKYAEAYPLEVATLHRMNGDLADLNGFPDEARIDQIDSTDALQRKLGKDDPRVLVQRLEVGDAFLQQGRVIAARDIYGSVAKQALRANLPLVRGHAMYRTAMLYSALSQATPGYDGLARKAIDAISETTDPALQPFRDAVFVLRTRIAKKRDVDAEIDRAVGKLKSRPATAPTLLYSPPPSEVGLDNLTIAFAPSGGSYEPQWADVSFWITPDGHVRDVSVLRASTNRSGDWLKRVSDALGKRRYTPVSDRSSPGTMRVERYTLVNDSDLAVGSRLAARSSKARLEVVDLSQGGLTG